MTDVTHDSPIEWDATTYARLGRPQEDWGRAVLETVALRGDECVVDAGCGHGGLTALLADRLPRGRVLAIDRSTNMLAVAAAGLARFGERVALVRADLSALPCAGSIDVIVSTAAFHWVLDHERLFRELHAALRPGGRLVAQCGGGPNLARLLGRAARIVRSPAYRAHLEGWSGPWRFADAPTTAARLSSAGFVDVETEVVEAPTVLPDRQRYTDFLAAVILRAHLDRLSGTRLGEALLERLADAGEADEPPFSLDYHRLNMRARKPS